MTGTGVRDPDDPDRWLVEPWPADASFDDVFEHFQQVSTTQLPPGTSTACLWAFHEGLTAALAAASTEEFTDQADRTRRDYLLNCADLGASLFRDEYIARHGRDPQTGEDQHAHTVKHRHDPQPPEP